jgi:hypothetical protein
MYAMDFTEIGIAGVFIIMVLREVFLFAGKRRNGGSGASGHQTMVSQSIDRQLSHIAKQMEKQTELLIRIEERLGHAQASGMHLPSTGT